jgi:hypothetical protein|tara:strand:- start:738 stop:1265 length:528 start_codon:yes stop_codon:yes gene_type:complete
MDIKFTPMFVLPLWSTKIANFSKKKKEFKKILKEYPEEHQNFNTFLTNQGKTDQQLIENFLKTLNDEFREFSQITKMCFKLTQVWSSTYEKYHYATAHNHGSTGYAGIIYLDFNKKSPPTTYIQPWNNIKDRTSLYTHPVKEGDMVIFPQSVLHYTEPNPISFKKRIISFNLERL